MLGVLNEMQRAYQEILNILAKGKLETTLPSIELNSDLLSRLDDMGFVLFLLEKLGLEVDPQVSASVMNLDSDMRKNIPRIIELYRKAGDDPTPYPDQFPTSFWWRQIQ
jgi:hypothetical protein